MRVSLSNSGRSFSALPGQSLLDAAIGAGMNLPHSCKSGHCGSCRARLLSGATHYPHGAPLGLSAAEAADGFILLCQARARSELAIDVPLPRPAAEAVIKRLPCRIERTAVLSHDVIALYLRLPAAEEFSFEAGQYIDVMLERGRRRSFSIASPPHDARPLELHVRRVAGGEFTERLFAQPVQGALLSIEGPLGQFHYRPGSLPMILAGGGTGLAPLQSMLRHLVYRRIDRDITLYWGVRAERDLYAHAMLLELAGRAPRLRYVPVLSEPPATWTGRRGLVHEAILEDHASCEARDIYASGPPAMIQAVRRELGARGANPERLFFDSFDYAPDALERQASSAPTSA